MGFWKKVGNAFKKAFTSIKNFIKKHWKLILLIIVICVAAYFAWQYFALSSASATTLTSAGASAGGSAVISAANAGKAAGYVGAAAVAPSSGIVSRIISTVTEIGKSGAKFVAENPGVVGAVGGGIALTGLLKNKKLLLVLGCGLLLTLLIVKSGGSKS